MNMRHTTSDVYTREFVAKSTKEAPLVLLVSLVLLVLLVDHMCF